MMSEPSRAVADFALSDDLYLRFRELLLTRSGLSYPDHKRGDLAHGLRMVLNAGDFPDLPSLYADALAGGPAWEAILMQLTIGETYFFRNGPQFDALRQHILPDLKERRTAIRTMRIWSAGCATGEEPYSLAMTLGDLLAGAEPWHITILATDINPAFLARAREALYSEWSFRETSDAQRARFFRQEGNRWRLNPEVRRMVTFARLNLAEPCYPSVVTGTCALDIIFCRNVTIYFDEATTRQVAERFYGALAPGGWLVVGHAEPQASVYHQFEVHNFPYTVLYRKPLDAPLFAFDSARSSGSAGERPAPEPKARRANAEVARIKGGSVHASSSTITPGHVYLAERGRTGPLSAASLPAEPPPPPLSTGDVWALITTRLAQGDKSGAERLLRDLLRVDSDHVPALTALGRLCADRGDWAAAQVHCSRAIELDALCVEAHYLQGQLYEHQGRLDDALAAYRRTTYLDRGFVLGLIGMANAWRQLGRTADAQRYYRNAHKLLSRMPAFTPIPGAEGATAGELAAFVAGRIAC